MSHTYQLGYRRDIDGLRAIAVLPVVLYHAHPNGMHGGFLGVDVFFVISGFLITSIIHKELGQGRFSVLRFYARRIRRIFPALISVLLATGAFGYLFLFPQEFENLAKHIIGGVAFVSNFVLWGEVGYFDMWAWEKPLLHLWSLGVEEQFYIVWPGLMILLMRLHRWRMTVIVAAFVASLALYQVLGVINGTAAFYLSLARFWELLAGAWLAVSGLHNTPHTKAKSVASVVAAVLLLAAFMAADEHDPSLYWITAFVVASATALIWAGPGALVNRWLLSHRAMVAVGLISYPLYLWHWPILTYLRIGQGNSLDLSWSEISFAIALAFLLSWLTYAVLEKNIRFRPGHAVVPALSGGMVAVTVAAAVVFTSGGLPGRMTVSPGGATTLLGAYPHTQQDRSCNATYPEIKDFWACMASGPAPADIILVGDSHANQYYQALVEAAPDRTVLNISSPGCFPFNGFDNWQCKDRQERMVAYLTALPEPTEVVLTGYFSFLSAAGFVGQNIEGQRVAQPLSDVTRARFLENGGWVLSALLDAGHRVTVVRDIPDLVDRPVNCLDIDAWLIEKTRVNAPSTLIREGNDCFLDRPTYEARNAPYLALLHDLTEGFPSVVVADPSKAFCDVARCYAIRDGEALFYNSDHLSLAGARGVMSYLASRPEGGFLTASD